MEKLWVCDFNGSCEIKLIDIGIEEAVCVYIITVNDYYLFDKWK